MRKSGRIYKLTAFLILGCFLLESVFPFPNYAQTLPAPTQFISLTPKFIPASVRGLRYPYLPDHADKAGKRSGQPTGAKALPRNSLKPIHWYDRL